MDDGDIRSSNALVRILVKSKGKLKNFFYRRP